jgi:hypothetical protein
MQLGIGMNLQSFCFLTQGRSEIRIFGRLTTSKHPAGDLMWMSTCNPPKQIQNSQVKNGG